MIKIENFEIYGLRAAVRGMRNPMNSWDKSDSERDGFGGADGFTVGTNDLGLMKRLIKGGTEHRKFLRMITVTTDIVAPLYWWKEFDTYKVGTVANSCSTMHKIHSKEFTLEDFSCEHLVGFDDYNHPFNEGYHIKHHFMNVLKDTITTLNAARKLYLETNDKLFWWQMIQLLPSSYNQRRTVQLNYEVLLAQYHQRKGHKLDEWRQYCEWVESLPYMTEFLEVAK